MAWIQEIYDTLYAPNTVCVACISHGKDSLAMLRAIKHLGLPLHRIITSDVWATQDIPADLPPMWEWKKQADTRIKELYGIEVEHICAMAETEDFGAYTSASTQFCNEKSTGGREVLRLCYEALFYRVLGEKGKYSGAIKGFPLTKGAWCKKLKIDEVDLRGQILSGIQRKRKENAKNWKCIRLCDKTQPLLSRRTQEITGSQCEREIGVRPISSQPYGFPISVRRGQWCQQLKPFSKKPLNEGRKINIVQYLGIAADEALRIKRHIGKPNIILPLVEIGWREDLCGLISGYQDLLSPSYDNSTRDGCWFCHNQSVGQLRLLRKNHPDLWTLLLKWDLDSPVSFKPDGHTVHDYDRRFAMEDEGIVSKDDPWKWKYLKTPPRQIKMF